MPDISKLSEVLPWLLQAGGMLFWVTYSHGLLENLRGHNTKVAGLSPNQMQALSLVVYLVPLALVEAIVIFVPPSFFVSIDPYWRLLVAALSVYSVQQWVHWTLITQSPVG